MPPKFARAFRKIGPAVIGASYTPMDGHVNPFKLLRALHTAMQARGVHARLGRTRGSHRSAQGQASSCMENAARIALRRSCSPPGLGNRGLAPFVGLHAPVAPNRGQVLVSERVAPFLDYPTLNVRQTDEGSVQFGDSMEEVGFDDFTTDACARRHRPARRVDAFRCCNTCGSCACGPRCAS
jgi:glycine/D-amino acid oxidase-like deaminating enzyme